MAKPRIYKPTYKRNGKKRSVGKYYLEFSDHRDQRRRLPAFTDKRGSEGFRDRVVELVGNVAGNKLHEESLTKWISLLRDDARKRRAQVGIFRQFLKALPFGVGQRDLRFGHSLFGACRIVGSAGLLQLDVGIDLVGRELSARR